ALYLVAAPVDLALRQLPGATLHQVLDNRIKVELLTVQERLDLAEQLRFEDLELTARLRGERGVAPQRRIERLRRALRQRRLDDATPVRLVVAGAEVPLVVVGVGRL